MVWDEPVGVAVALALDEVDRHQQVEAREGGVELFARSVA